MYLSRYEWLADAHGLRYLHDLLAGLPGVILIDSYRTNRVTTPGLALPGAAGTRRPRSRSPEVKVHITVNVNFVILVILYPRPYSKNFETVRKVVSATLQP